MASNLTIGMNDAGFNISTGINLAYVTTSTTGSIFKFRYLVEVIYNIDNSYGATPQTRSIQFTQQKNNDGAGIFNLSEIYKSIVTPQITSAKKSEAPASGGLKNQYSSIHTLPHTEVSGQYMFSWGILNSSNGWEAFKGVANVMTLKFYEMYSTSENGVPVRDDDSLVTKTIYMFWGRGEEQEGVVINFDEYKLDGTFKNWLSGNYNHYEDSGVGYSKLELSKDEYHTMAFLNKCPINSISEIKDVWIKLYDASNILLADIRILNGVTSGGSLSGILPNEGFYLYVGVGIKNLEKLDYSNTNYSFTPNGNPATSIINGEIDGVPIARYYVATRDSSFAYTSRRYIFDVIEYCPNYEQSRLAYMNRWGAWEYITLNKERKDELSVKREYITKPLINQSSTLGQFTPIALNGSYPLDVAKQGQMTTSVAPEITTTMFTDNLDDIGVAKIQDLMMSPQIHLLDGEDAKALVLMNTNFKMKRGKNRGLYNYELKFKFANPKYRTT